MTAPRLIFVNRFFHPDHSATSQMLSDLSFELGHQGWDVRVVASRLRYDDPSADLPAKEEVGGVGINRVRTTRFGRGNLLGRALDYLTFYPSAAWRLFRLAHRGDVVVIKTDPPLFAIPAVLVCGLRGARTVQWVQDLFPEIAAAYGVGAARGLPGRLLRGLRNVAYRRAAACVVLGSVMKERLLAEGVSTERIRILPNWSDGAGVRPVAPGDNALRAEWELQDRFVVGYSGNLGRAHDTETLVGGGKRLAQEDPDVSFLLVGGGAMRPVVEKQVAREELGNFRFCSYQPRDRLSESLGAADVHLVCLRPDMEGLVFPSKLYGALAAGRPVVFVGDPDGEAARMLRENDCGVAVPQGDAQGLAWAIRELKADPERVKGMGERARALFEVRFDRAKALSDWEGLLAEVAGVSSEPEKLSETGGERSA